MSFRYTAQRFCENLNIADLEFEGKYDIPVIAPESFIQLPMISFNYITSKKKLNEYCVHFFIDDYQFDRLWRNVERYVTRLLSCGAMMAPDFSMFTDWPMAVQIMNHYKKHFIAAYMQSLGMKVYPTINWSTEASYDWCFDGEPTGATVCVSSVGTQRDKSAQRLFKNGYDAMIERLNPETIVFYGVVPKECKGNIVRIKPFYEKFYEVKVDGT